MKELNAIVKLTESFKNFSSVGSKTAERMAFNVISMDDNTVDELIKNIKEVKEKIHPCQNCGLLIEGDKCPICSSIDRDHSICIVLSHNKDVYNFEKGNTYKGTYHVLNGDLSSLKGITPSDLRINELLERIEKENIKEIIIATNPTIEGETTALYLAKILENMNIKITRLAYGIPMGGNLEYADELTIQKAIEGRTIIK